MKNLYLDTIKEAFPKALIVWVDNFDDYHYGWEISPVPGHLIRFYVSMKDEMYLKIMKYTISYGERPVLLISKMFKGVIPANHNIEIGRAHV